jgi:hypothetical protein
MYVHAAQYAQSTAIQINADEAALYSHITVAIVTYVKISGGHVIVCAAILPLP